MSWRAHAECATGRHDPDLWFPGDSDSGAVKKAKAVCNVLCPVRDECREFAVKLPMALVGVWGGLSRREVREARLKRGIPAITEAQFSGLPRDAKD